MREKAPEVSEDDGEEHPKRKPFRQPFVTPRRIIGAIGLCLIAWGYDKMSVPPDAPIDEALDGGINGILTVILGAALAVFAILFK